MWLKTFYDRVDRYKRRQTVQSSSNPARTEVVRANKGVKVTIFDSASSCKKAELAIDPASWVLLKAEIDKKMGVYYECC